MPHLDLRKAIARPDHGWCWVIFACACLLNFLQSGILYSFGVLFTHLVKEMDESEEKIAWIGSIAGCLNMLGAYPAVKLSRKIGIPCAWFCGTLLCTSGIISTSFARSKYLMYFTYGVLYGFGSSFFLTIAMNLLTLLFKTYKAITIALVVASGSVGCLVLAPVLEYSLSEFGIKATLITEGLVVFCVGSMCSLLVIPVSKRDEVHAEIVRVEINPANVLAFDNEIAKISHNGLGEVDLTHEEAIKTPTLAQWNLGKGNMAQTSSNAMEKKKDERFRKSLFKRKEYLLFLVIMVAADFPYFIPLFHLINYAEKLGTSSSKATLLITIWSACHVVGCATFALIATRYPTKRLLTYQVAMLVSGIASILASVADKYSLLLTYSIVHGFLDGSFSGLQPLITLEVVGTADMSKGYGFLNCIIAIPCSLGPIIVGWINDTKTLPLRSMFYLTGVPFIIGSLLMFLLMKWVPHVVSAPRMPVHNQVTSPQGRMT